LFKADDYENPIKYSGGSCAKIDSEDPEATALISGDDEASLKR